MQLSLLSEVPEIPDKPAIAPIEPPVKFYPKFLDRKDHQALFTLSNRLDWQRNSMTMLGKSIQVPRDEAIYGDPGISYSYRDITLTAKPWPIFLKKLRDRVQEETGYKFPFVIGNRYNSGKDSIGYHADDSPEIGERPAIASISLGGMRKFKIKPKDNSSAATDYWLEAGSLLVMLPGCQEEWVHAVPKTARLNEQRINWTFRPYARGL